MPKSDPVKVMKERQEELKRLTGIGPTIAYNNENIKDFISDIPVLNNYQKNMLMETYDNFYITDNHHRSLVELRYLAGISVVRAENGD